MASLTQLRPEFPGNHEARLLEFGLSTTKIHNGFLPGLMHAQSRSGLALKSSPANDIYHDTYEHLGLILAPDMWKLHTVNHQPRLIHPDRTIAIVVASATGVGGLTPRHDPVTRRKGPATHDSIRRASSPDSIFLDIPGLSENEAYPSGADEAPL